MSQTWYSDAPPDETQIGLAAALRILCRGGAVILVILAGLFCLFSLRLFENVFRGAHPAGSRKTVQIVCRIALRLMGLRVRRHGKAMTGKGVMVANHSSWLDIFVLNAAAPVTFVSKSEVGSWPGIGWLAKATGTVFIDRDPRQAVTQNALFQDHLHKGTQLLFFPEGTSTDGLQVLAFKTTLFQSLVTSPERETLALQPMSVAYHAPKGKDPRFYGWWGDMPFGPHLLKILGADRHGSVDVQLHPPLTIGACANRKELAQASEARVRTGHASFTRDARPRGSADHSL